MPQSICRDESVRGDDEGEEADYGEGREEDTGDGCDRSLHQFAVGVVCREKSYWGKNVNGNISSSPSSFAFL